MCAAAETAGALNNQGQFASGAARASFLRTHPTLLAPVCAAAVRSDLKHFGDNAAVEQYLPTGGSAALAATFCRSIGPYIQKTGAIDQALLDRDRGRGLVVPLCIASSLALVQSTQGFPYDLADSRKIFTHSCAEGWDKGYISMTGVNHQAYTALVSKVAGEMVRSGQVTAPRTEAGCLPLTIVSVSTKGR